MLKVFVLILYPSTGEPVLIAAYDGRADCMEVAGIVAVDLQPGAYVECVPEVES